jgi:dienelactone hydrolase
MLLPEFMKNNFLYILFLSIPLVSGCTAHGTPVYHTQDVLAPIKLSIKFAHENKAAPTVLIGHGSAGVTRGNQELARVLKEWGYNSIIVDHYTLRGITRHTGREAPGARGKDRALDFIRVARWAHTQSWHTGKIAVIGFSQGGGGVLSLANKKLMGQSKNKSTDYLGPIVAAVAFYPSCYFNPVPKNTPIPIQIHLAEDDDLARTHWCRISNQSLYVVHRYKNATHSFDENIPSHIPLTFTHRFNHQITEKSRKNLKEFLDQQLFN